jgi:hypothetical protein
MIQSQQDKGSGPFSDNIQKAKVQNGCMLSSSVADEGSLLGIAISALLLVRMV